MKILWLSWKSITHPDAGGAEIYGHEIAKVLVSAGHQVTWISLSPENWQSLLLSFPRKRESIPTATTKDGVKYYYIGNRILMYTGLFHLFIFINYIINWRHHFDLIIDEIHGPPLLTPLYARKPKLTVIHEVAGDIWHKTIPFPFSWLMAHLVEPLFFVAYRNQNIITVSESTKNDLIKLGVNAQHIVIIHNGFTPPPAELLNLPKEPNPTLIFLSEIRPMKGLDRVLAAYQKIKQQIPNIQLWVVGNDQLPYAQHFKAQVQSDASITFFGKVDEAKKYHLLARAHLLVHGSYKEGWGRVVIEANAVGTPAIVFDADGLREAVQHQQTGFVAKHEAEFVEFTTKLIRNHDKYLEFQSNAIILSRQFTWENSTISFIKLINSIIKL